MSTVNRNTAFPAIKGTAFSATTYVNCNPNTLARDLTYLVLKPEKASSFCYKNMEDVKAEFETPFKYAEELQENLQTVSDLLPLSEEENHDKITKRV